MGENLFFGIISCAAILVLAVSIVIDSILGMIFATSLVYVGAYYAGKYSERHWPEEDK